MIVGVLLACLTSVCWAFGNVFIQKSGRAVGAPRAMVWALLAGLGLSSLGSGLLEHSARSLDPAVVGWAALAGAAGLLAYVCLFYAFERAPLSIAVPLISIWSLIAAAFSVAVFGERLRAIQILGAATVFAGVVLVSVGSSRKDGAASAPTAADEDAPKPRRPERKLRAGWVAFGSALGFGVMVPVLGRVSSEVGELGALALVYGIGLGLAVPLGLALGIDLRPPPRALWGLVLVTGCFETMGFVTIAFARRFAPMAVVTPVASLAAALTVLYAWVVLRERPDRLSTAGACLACGGIVILSVQ